MMLAPRIGSLCSGAGGLDLAVEHVTGGRTIWHAEYDDDAAKVLETRWPSIPNHRDITETDWRAVEPIDVLTAGYPCQPFSQAGKRKGTDDERHLWPHVAKAIRVLRPGLVVLENVAGHRSMGFGDVLADLAAMRYVGSWCSLRASDIGANHERERVFITAYPEGDGRARFIDRPGRATARSRWEWLAPRGSGLPVVPLALLPTPMASDSSGGGQHPSKRTSRHTRQLIDVALLYGSSQWDRYVPAIRHWESLTRSVPTPTEIGSKGNPRLAAAFSEWMQGWPLGWVTSVPISRSAMLRIIGNGVVPQQAVAALYWLLSVSEVAA